MIAETFTVMCRLHDEDRNHIWNYYIRNLARPVWLAMFDNRVDVLIGNPPWLSYRNMPSEMQAIFQQLSKDRGLWHGKQVATQQDLSALFVARMIQQYLKPGGKFGFVMPNAALDRGYYQGFQSGWYQDPIEPVAVKFTEPWDLRRLRPHFFPRGSSVVFGFRTTYEKRQKMPKVVEVWRGTLPDGANSWSTIESHVQRVKTDLAQNDKSSRSVYADRFSIGATIWPRALFVVEAEASGPLGLGGGRRAVRSAVSSYEKQPWKDMRRLEGVIEAEFVRPILLSENIVPFRVLDTREAVLPIVDSDLLDGNDPRMDHYPGLSEWWQQAEGAWTQHRSSDRLELMERLDFHRDLTNQLPTPRFRVVYAKSGMHVVAALATDSRPIIDHSLYWGVVSNLDEGNYLCAVVNSPIVTELVRPLMAYGKDERHVDKQLWQLPISQYNASNSVHCRLAQLGAELAGEVSKLPLRDANFVVLRRRVRQFMATHAAATEIDRLIRTMEW
jgi:hypothetical protein